MYYFIGVKDVIFRRCPGHRGYSIGSQEGHKWINTTKGSTSKVPQLSVLPSLRNTVGPLPIDNGST